MVRSYDFRSSELYKGTKNKDVSIVNDNLNSIKKKLRIKSETENDIKELQIIKKENVSEVIKKDLNVTINGTTLIGGLSEIFISLKAVNKSIRPIIVNSYGLDIIKEDYVVIINPYHPELKFLNTPLPWKLNDGESCSAYISRSAFEDIMKEKDWEYPLQVRAAFQTNDGKFYSEEMSLKEQNL